MAVDLNLEAASAIYTSVICDTGRFSYSSTNRKAHKIADECLKLGVNPDFMHERLFQQLSMEQFTLFAKILRNTEFYFENRILLQEIALEDLSEADKLELFYEWIDGLHFYMNFAISIGMTSKDIVNLYMAKNAENHDRQNRGY